MNEIKYVHDYYTSWAQGTYLYTKWAADHGISYPELMVFYALYTRESLTQRDISDCYGVPKQTVNNVIRSLKAEDYIRLEASDRDKREKLVALTEKGRAYSGQKLASLLEIEARVCKMIGREKLSQMIETAEMFNVLLETEMDKERKKS